MTQQTIGIGQGQSIPDAFAAVQANFTDLYTRGFPGIVVAASDSSDRDKAIANFVCDGTDDQEQINAAVDLVASTGGTVFLMPGLYVGEGIKLLNGVNFIGMGGAGAWGRARIKLPASPTNHLFTAPTSAQIYSGSVQNLHLHGGNSSEYDAQNDLVSEFDGLDFSTTGTVHDYLIDNCKIEGFRRGISGPGSDRKTNIRNCKIWTCGIGVYVRNSHPWLNGVDFRFNVVGLGGYGYDMHHIIGCNFNRCTYGIKPDDESDGFRNCVLTACTFYQNVTYDANLGFNCTVQGGFSAPSPTSESGLIFENADNFAVLGHQWITIPDAKYSEAAIVFGRTRGCRIHDNHFGSYANSVGTCIKAKNFDSSASQACLSISIAGNVAHLAVGTESFIRNANGDNTPAACAWQYSAVRSNTVQVHGAITMDPGVIYFDASTSNSGMQLSGLVVNATNSGASGYWFNGIANRFRITDVLVNRLTRNYTQDTSLYEANVVEHS